MHVQTQMIDFPANGGSTPGFLARVATHLPRQGRGRRLDPHLELVQNSYSGR